MMRICTRNKGYWTYPRIWKNYSSSVEGGMFWCYLEFRSQADIWRLLSLLWKSMLLSYKEQRVNLISNKRHATHIRHNDSARLFTSDRAKEQALFASAERAFYSRSINYLSSSWNWKVVLTDVHSVAHTLPRPKGLRRDAHTWLCRDHARAQPHSKSRGLSLLGIFVSMKGSNYWSWICNKQKNMVFR